VRDERRFTMKTLRLAMAVVAALAVGSTGLAETCQTASDMDAATKAALSAAGTKYFDMVAKGDTTGLQQNSIPALASDFSGIGGTVKEQQSALAGSKGTARPPFVLQTDATAARSEFFCGVFGSKGQTADSATFTLSNLPAGKYAVVILDATTAKGPYTVSLVLQQLGSDWKLGGLYIKAGQSAGHDGNWYVTKAKEYQGKGQAHNAWLYYVEARTLISPLPFMSTAVTDKLYDDSQKLQPADLPVDGKTVDLAANGGSFRLTAVFPEVVGSDLDLIVRYQATDVADTNKAYAGNMAVMKALVAKFPELKDAFGGIVARAVDASGRDYGTLMAMKDIK